jgi:hypothetical protein
VERNFADAKRLHEHRFARMRGGLHLTEKCLVTEGCGKHQAACTIVEPPAAAVTPI